MIKYIKTTLLSSVICLLPCIAKADPTEIFVPSESINNAPNVLFILDFSGSMGGQKVIDLKAAFREVMKDADKNTNVGILPFSGGAHIRVSFPVKPIEETVTNVIGGKSIAPVPTQNESIRNFLVRHVDSFPATGGTPIGDSLYEMALYYRGDSPKEGNGVSHVSSLSGSNYISPIQSKCQKNYAVLMSDGAPGGTRNSSLIQSLIGGGCAASVGVGGGQCARELVQYLYNNDQSSTLEGKQIVETFSIGFQVSAGTGQYLQSLATAKDGAGYYAASNVTALKNAFKDILETAKTEATSFSTPTFSADTDNLLAHDDEVFVPVFGFTNGATWPGNLRKFKIKDDGSLIDKNDKQATNELGEFEESSQGFWSSSASGKEVTVGGAAHKLPAPSARSLFTDRPENNQLMDLSEANKDLAATLLIDLVPSSTTIGSGVNDGWSESEQKKYKYKIKNIKSDQSGAEFKWPPPKPQGFKGMTTEQINIAIAQIRGGTLAGSSANDGLCISGSTNDLPYCITNDYRKQLINFTRGISKTGTARKHMGDILHSKPVTYRYDKNNMLVFVGTNEGYVHAFDANTGVEKWAFMPSELLKNAYKFYENVQGAGHIYGVDSELIIWENDINKDRKIQQGKGEGIYLFFGLGQGGQSYFALDITNPQKPSLAWKASVTDNTFSDLGTTWSKPMLSGLRQETGGKVETTKVLVFGAGYDNAKSVEDISEREADSQGKNIYIVNAKTGKRLWALSQVTGYSQLTHSITGDIRVLDLDANGALDRLYFADTGGNVWRVDMDADFKDKDASLFDYKDARLTKLASLGEGDHGEDHRKFFVAPDISILKHEGETKVLVSLGSGYRMHPLNTKTKDFFYVFEDGYGLSLPPKNTTPLTHIDLVDSKNLKESFLDEGKNGWYSPLDFEGEKVMAASRTFLNKVMFTTFSVADREGHYNGEKECSFNERSARIYILDILTGKAVADLTGDGSKDRYAVVGTSGFLDTPQIVYKPPTSSDGGECTKSDCVQYFDVRVGTVSKPLFGKENANLSGNAKASESANALDASKTLYWRNSSHKLTN